MNNIEKDIQKLYPGGRIVEYNGKNGNLNVTLKFSNKYRTAFPDFAESMFIFLILAMIYGIMLFPCLCFIPSPVWANIVFFGLFIGVTICSIAIGEGECSEGEIIAVVAINIMLMLLTLLLTWQIQAHEPNNIQQTVFLDFLFKFKL